MGGCTLEDNRNFAAFHFFHTKVAYEGYHVSELSAAQIHEENTNLIVLVRGLGGDKALWAAQMSKAQLTIEK